MSGRRASKVRERAAPQAENEPRRHSALPAPLDSGLRRNDEWGAGMTNGGAGNRSAGAVVCGHSRGHVRSFSYQPLTPAGAGTPRYEKPESWVGSANWHGGFCHSPPRPQRGTSPRTTLALGRLSPIFGLTFCRAGLTIPGIRGFRSHDPRRVKPSRIGVRDMLSYEWRTRSVQMVPPVFVPMKELCAGGPAMECGRTSGVGVESWAYGVNGSGQG